MKAKCWTCVWFHKLYNMPWFPALCDLHMIKIKPTKRRCREWVPKI